MTTPARSSLRRGLGLLRDRDFGVLFSARFVTSLGSGMAPIAMAFGVLEQTGSERDVGVVLAAHTAAMVAVLLLGGALADRLPRRRLLFVADAISGGAQLAIGALLVAGTASVSQLAGLMVVAGAAAGLHWPALQGLVPEVVRRDHLQAANALLSIAQSAALGLGMAAAGVGVAAVGAGVVLGIDGLTFLASAGLVLALRIPARAVGLGESMWQSLRGGWREFTRHRWLWAIVLQFSFVVAARAGGYGVLGPVVAESALGGPSAFSWIGGAYGVGLIAGGVFALRLRVERPMVVGTIAVLFYAAPVVVFAPPLSVVGCAIGAFAGAFASQVFSVLWMTALFEHVRPEAISRVVSYDVFGSIALTPLGQAAAGWLASELGPAPALWLATGAIVVPTLAVLAVPEVWTLRSASADAHTDAESGGAAREPGLDG